MEQYLIKDIRSYVSEERSSSQVSSDSSFDKIS